MNLKNILQLIDIGRHFITNFDKRRRIYCQTLLRYCIKFDEFYHMHLNYYFNGTAGLLLISSQLKIQ